MKTSNDVILSLSQRN